MRQQRLHRGLAPNHRSYHFLVPMGIGAVILAAFAYACGSYSDTHAAEIPAGLDLDGQWRIHARKISIQAARPQGFHIDSEWVSPNHPVNSVYLQVIGSRVIITSDNAPGVAATTLLTGTVVGNNLVFGGAVDHGAHKEVLLSSSTMDMTDHSFRSIVRLRCEENSTGFFSEQTLQLDFTRSVHPGKTLHPETSVVFRHDLDVKQGSLVIMVAPAGNMHGSGLTANFIRPGEDLPIQLTRGKWDLSLAKLDEKGETQILDVISGYSLVGQQTMVMPLSKFSLKILD